MPFGADVSVAAVASAAVVAAGVTFAVVVVMVAFCIGVIIELSADISNYRLVSTATYPTEEFNAYFSQSILCSATDTATDKHLNT